MTAANQHSTGKAAAGASAEPFSGPPDMQFYFAFDAFEKRLAMLASLVAGTDVIVLVIGEPGSGKTTLLKRYLQQTTAPWKACRIRCGPAATTAGRRPAEKDRGFAAYILQEGANPVIMVDDAQRLDRSQLRFLLQGALVPGGSQKIKRLVLFGPPDLYTAVNAVSESFAAATAINKVHLPALTREETAAYLEHRLAAAGATAGRLLDEAVVNKIHQTTGGIPGAVNEAARQLPVNAAGGRTTTRGGQMLKNITAKRLAWTAAAILALLLILLWLYLAGKSRESKARAHKPAVPVFRAKIRSGRSSRVIKPVRKPGTERKPTPAAISKSIPLPASTAPKSIPPPAVVPKSPPTKPAVVAMRPKPAVAATAVPVPQTAASIAPGRLQREKWLLSQNPAHYTIQILGVRTEKSLLEFIRENQLEKQTQLAAYRGTYRGKTWYRLLYGVFVTRQQAESAALGLPTQIQRTSPWVRRLSSVQRDIRR